MGLLSTLKSLLGMEDEGNSAGSGVDVTVEREPSAESERAVKEPDEEVDSTPETTGDETDSAETEWESEPEDEPASESEDEESEDEETADEAAGGDDEPVATETDASASTESLVDEDHTDDSTRAAEPAEAAGPDDDGSDAVEGDSVTVLKGIGPAYADRLSEAGVDTVAELAAADVEDLAERVDLSPKRVGRWVETAQDYE